LKKEQIVSAEVDPFLLMNSYEFSHSHQNVDLQPLDFLLSKE
jgi:hypothetical protein